MLFGVSLPLGVSCHNTHPKLHTEFGTGRGYTSISHGLPGTDSYREDQTLLLSAVTPSSSPGTGHLAFANPGPGLERGLNTAAPVQPLPQHPPTTPVEKRAMNQPTPTCLSGLPCHFPLDISIILLCLQLRTSTKRPLLSSSPAARSNKAAQAPAPAGTKRAARVRGFFTAAEGCER